MTKHTCNGPVVWSPFFERMFCCAQQRDQYGKALTHDPLEALEAQEARIENDEWLAKQSDRVGSKKSDLEEP